MTLEKLVDAGLAYQGLIPINNKEMLRRYNRCLASLGLKQTDRESIMIDGVGWSPEIAQDLGDKYYLSHGPANMLGIILTPEQRHRPVYVPTHSFDRDLLDAYHALNQNSIIDVTRTEGITLNFENHVTEYRTPLDVLDLRDITVCSGVGGLREARHEQMKLVESFSKEGWFDRKVRIGLAVSGKQYGDLRSRQIELPDLVFAEFGHFHIDTCGGVFVLRDVHKEDLLILESGKAQELDLPDGVDAINLSDVNAWIERLVKAKLIEVNFSWYRDNLEQLEAKARVLTAFSIMEADADADFISMTPEQQKGKLRELSRAGKLPDVYHEFEHLAQAIRQNRGKIKEPSHDSALWRFLVRPAVHVQDSDKALLWMLLCRLEPRNILSFYIHDKNGFFEVYKSWSVPLQTWATQYLKDRYVPRMYQGDHAEETAAALPAA